MREPVESRGRKRVYSFSDVRFCELRPLLQNAAKVGSPPLEWEMLPLGARLNSV